MGKQYKQLTLVERYQIEALVQLDFSARQIAKELKRGNKAISSELHRCPQGLYTAKTAHTHALNKRSCAAKFMKVTDELNEKVKSFLSLDFSPEQMAGRMKKEAVTYHASMHTLYRLIARNGWRHRLPRQGKTYRKRAENLAGAALIPDRVDISERPDEVEDKEEIGHWEADTVHGTDGYFVTLAERKTKLFLFDFVKRKTKSAVSRAIIKMLKPYKTDCKTITFDNGGEFAGHMKIAKALKCKTYFAKPYHSWQRGLNENSNGLLRRYFPKRTSIANITKKALDNVRLLINIRPRKTLDYLSPIEAFTGKRVSLMSRI